MWEDPIVKEVRKARLEIEQECGSDFHKIYEHALKIQKQAAKKKGAGYEVKRSKENLPLAA